MKWTKDKCYVEALKYKYRYDFSINNNSAYRAALKYNWMSEICSHMKCAIGTNQFKKILK